MLLKKPLISLTNNENIAKRLKYLRTSGNTKDKSLMHTYPDNEIWNYQQVELGFNYRMSDIMAALGLSQMKLRKVLKF